MTDRPDRRLAWTAPAAALAVGALAVGALAGCAGQTPGSQTSMPAPDPRPTSTGATTTPPSETPAATPPAVPTSPTTDGAILTVTGTVEAGVEHGCLVLVAEGETYLLLGAGDRLREGERVTVDGVLATDVVTTCQQGTPLRVQAVRPG